MFLEVLQEIQFFVMRQNGLNFRTFFPGKVLLQIRMCLKQTDGSPGSLQLHCHVVVFQRLQNMGKEFFRGKVSENPESGCTYIPVPFFQQRIHSFCDGGPQCHQGVCGGFPCVPALTVQKGKQGLHIPLFTQNPDPFQAFLQIF